MNHQASTANSVHSLSSTKNLYIRTMSNIREVAKKAGVSVATVSRALSHPEKVSPASIAKVKKAIEEVNYRPNMLARNFRSARSYSIVVLVPDISNPFFSLVIRCIEAHAQKRGYSVLLGDTQDNDHREKEYIRMVETRLADGIIQLRPQSSSFAAGMSLELPYVNVCGTEGTVGCCIRVDNRAGMCHMVDYLTSLKHRRIAIVTGLRGNPHTVDRMKGYKQGLEKAGIKFDRNLVAEGEYNIWSGVNAANQLSSLNDPPTAIVCMNDEMAIGAIQALRTKNIRVPHDVSVTGFDDIDYAKHCDPPLTTIAQPRDTMAQIAVDYLLRRIEGDECDPPEKHFVLPYDFVLRKSIAEAPEKK